MQQNNRKSKDLTLTDLESEPEFKRRMKPGPHSRKDGWREPEELSTDLSYIGIANEGRTFEA